MSKDAHFDLMCRIDIPYEYYKDLQDSWEYQEHIKNKNNEKHTNNTK